MPVDLPPISAIEAYERYIVRSLFRPWTEDLIARIDRIAAKRILDLACGTGIVTRMLAPRAPVNVAFTGLDISPGMLAKAEALTEDLEAQLEWQEGCATCMPFPEDAFELILCQQGLQFFPDHYASLKEIQRVLVPGGSAIISVWGPLEHNPFYGVIDELVSAHLAEGALAAPFSLSNSDQLHALTTSAGLKVASLESVGLEIHATEPHYFAAMCLRGATAVLREFAALTQAARKEVLERMHAAMDKALRRFQRNDELVFRTTANVFTVTH